MLPLLPVALVRGGRPCWLVGAPADRASDGLCCRSDGGKPDCAGRRARGRRRGFRHVPACWQASCTFMLRGVQPARSHVSVSASECSGPAGRVERGSLHCVDGAGSRRAGSSGLQQVRKVACARGPCMLGGVAALPTLHPPPCLSETWPSSRAAAPWPWRQVPWPPLPCWRSTRWLPVSRRCSRCALGQTGTSWGLAGAPAGQRRRSWLPQRHLHWSRLRCATACCTQR